VSEKGIATDPEKVRTVTEWPVTGSLRELRAFLGLAGYYRRFVNDFALLAAPMYALIKQENKFRWTDEAQQSFDTIKAALTSSPILAMPTDSGEFILDTDASNCAIGAVLSQTQLGHERVVAYASRRLDKRDELLCGA